METSRTYGYVFSLPIRFILISALRYPQKGCTGVLRDALSSRLTLLTLVY